METLDLILIRHLDVKEKLRDIYTDYFAYRELQMLITVSGTKVAKISRHEFTSQVSRLNYVEVHFMFSFLIRKCRSNFFSFKCTVIEKRFIFNTYSKLLILSKNCTYSLV